MAEHDVRFRVPTRPISNADVEFDVFRDGEKYGTLHVSKGAVVWRPKDKSYGYRLNWKQLDAAFTDKGSEVKP